MAIPLKYNLRSLRVRWITSLLTLVGIALVTLILVFVFAMSQGIDQALVTSGHPLNLIALRSGAQNETHSAVTKKQVDDVAGFAGVEKDARGEAMVSGELLALANVPKTDGGKSNLIIRGVGPRARELRENIRVVEGRWFRPSVGEVVVGEGARARFAGLGVGDQPFIRGRKWTIVGSFAADGQAYESEVWGDIDDIKTQFKREYSAVLIRCKTREEVERLGRALKEDKQIRLEGKPHREYYKEQNQMALMIQGMGALLALVLTVGAVFGAANTMYGAVAARTVEIATMRVLGFSRGAIWFSFILESAFLGLLGGVLGALAGVIVFNVIGVRGGTANWASFSELAFYFRASPELLAVAVLMAALTAVAGGLFPAFRAARATIASALRGL